MSLTFDGVDEADMIDEVPDPPEDETPIDEPLPEVTLRDAKRGECRVCGDKAKDGRSFYCNDHIMYSPSAGKVTALGAPRGERTVDQIESSRKRGLKRKFKKLILDNNDKVVQAGQMMAKIPEPWMDQVVAEFTVQQPNGTIEHVKLWEPSLRTQLQFTEQQADCIADLVIEFESSSQGQQLQKFLTSFAPIIKIGIAAGVLLQHSMKLQSIKRDVAKVKDHIAQQELAQQPPIDASLLDPDARDEFGIAS